MTGGTDPEYADVDPAQSSMELIIYAMAMADERARTDRRHRHDLIQADIDGEKLSDDEFGFFVIMLAVAGTDHPQLHHPRHDRLREQPGSVGAVQEGRPSTTADEIVRWATPVSAFQRTANEDTVLSGVQIRRAAL